MEGTQSFPSRNPREDRQRLCSEGGQPLGWEGGFTEDVRLTRALLPDKSWQGQPHVQRHQAVNKGFSIIAGGSCGKLGVVAEIWAGEGGSDGIRKGLGGSLPSAYFIL